MMKNWLKGSSNQQLYVYTVLYIMYITGQPVVLGPCESPFFNGISRLVINLQAKPPATAIDLK